MDTVIPLVVRSLETTRLLSASEAALLANSDGDNRQETVDTPSGQNYI